MCGRFLLHEFDATQHLRLGIPASFIFKPRYNIAPSSVIPVYSQNQRWEFMSWGYTPHWLKDKENFKAPINIRSETVFEKPMFRDSILQKKCVIPFTGYYEWKTVRSRKQPFLIQTSSTYPSYFAGFWDKRQDVFSCALLTKDAQESIKHLHERMPLVLNQEDARIWCLLTKKKNIENFINERLTSSHNFFYTPVSLYVNNPKNDTKECIEALQ